MGSIPFWFLFWATLYRWMGKVRKYDYPTIFATNVLSFCFLVPTLSFHTEYHYFDLHFLFLAFPRINSLYYITLSPGGGGGGGHCQWRLYQMRKNRPQKSTLNKDLTCLMVYQNTLLTGHTGQLLHLKWGWLSCLHNIIKRNPIVKTNSNILNLTSRNKRMV